MSTQSVHNSDHSNFLQKLQGIWNKSSKQISYVSAVIILIAGAYIGYNKFIAEPNERKAEDAIFKAEEYFRMDSLNLALNGDGANKGFLYVIKNYGSTKSGNLAKFYSGVCYLKLKDFNNAVKYLSDFSSNSKQIQMIAYGRLADAYSELGKNDDALNNYKKAANHFTSDEGNSSEFLFRAAYLAESLGKTSDALELYKTLKAKYPKTEKGYQADKYIYRLSIEKNEFSVK